MSLPTLRVRSAAARVVLAAGVCSALVGAPAVAQAVAHDSSTRISVVTGRDAAVTAALAAAAVAVAPADERIALWSQRTAARNGGGARHVADAFNFIGGPGTIAIGAATYVAGRLDHSSRAEELGLRTLESIAAGSAIGYVVKGVVGRARPYAVGDTLPHDFHPGRGFHDDRFTSFPSGHAIAAFATATAMSQEIRYLWPHSSPMIAPALYGGAVLVGAARVYTNKHWASDVLAGAAVGILAGRTVVRYQRAHPGNRLDRWLVPDATTVTPDGRTVVAWSVRW